MFLFSPEKLLVILLVALVVVGPDKLPKLAGQVGALWRDLQGWRARLEGEARSVFPDLPPLETIGQAVRSPLSYLDRLAKEGSHDDKGEGEKPELIVPPTKTSSSLENEIEGAPSESTLNSSIFDPSMN